LGDFAWRFGVDAFEKKCSTAELILSRTICIFFSAGFLVYSGHG